MRRCSPHCELLQHIRRVQQVHILAQTCYTLKMAPHHPSVAGLVSPMCSTGLLYSLTDKAAEATRLVLEARQVPDQNCTTWEDSPAMRAMKQAVYGSASATASLSELLYSASVQQTKAVKRWCVAVLSQSLTTSESYFVILEAAVQAGMPLLLEEALDVVCSRCSHAVTADSTGWAGLSQEAVMLVLCSNKLQVDSEKDVLEALAAWIQARPQRTCIFQDMFVKAVRMDDMTYTELQEIDSHPLVFKHMKAYMQVAHALLAWHIAPPRRTASTASRYHGTRTGHRQHHGTRTGYSRDHGDSFEQRHKHGRRSRQSAVQRLSDHQQQQQTVTHHDDALDMQPVTDRCSTRDDAKESSHMQQPDASLLQSAAGQQDWGLPEAPSQHIHMVQPSQDDCMGQLSQQNVVRQMSHMLTPGYPDQQQHDPSDQLQNQSQRLHDCSDEEDQIQLSYSLDAELSCELDLQSSAVSQLLVTTAAAGQDFHVHSDAGPHQVSEYPRVSEAPQQAVGASQTPLTVRTEKTLRLHVRLPCTTVQEEMAGSPSAAHGRRKQARLESTRCLKF